MAVGVDPAGQDEPVARVEVAPRRPEVVADRRDDPVADTDIHHGHALGQDGPTAADREIERSPGAHAEAPSRPRSADSRWQRTTCPSSRGLSAGSSVSQIGPMRGAARVEDAARGGSTALGISPESAIRRPVPSGPSVAERSTSV